MINGNNISAVVWDWNGTLLDDVDVCVQSINIMLAQRNIPLVDAQSYRDIFGFPVKDYYEKLGFNFSLEPFDVVAIQFIDIYRQHLAACKLHKDVQHMLNYIRLLNIPQYVLSAMEQGLLEISLAEKGIIHYFSHVFGTGDHFADGKIGSARRLQRNLNSNPGSILLIGDTIHDHEVAEIMGWQSLLIGNGHQSRSRLEATGCNVLDTLGSMKWWWKAGVVK